MGIRKEIRRELETLRIYRQADRAITASIVLPKPPTEPFGTFLTVPITYFYERLVAGKSQEELAIRSRSLIKTFSKPV